MKVEIILFSFTSTKVTLQSIVEDLSTNEPKGMTANGEHEDKLEIRVHLGKNRNSEPSGKAQVLMNDYCFDEKFSCQVGVLNLKILSSFCAKYCYIR